MSATSAITQPTKPQLREELTRLKVLQEARAGCLETASKVCLCCSLPTFWCHMLACSFCMLHVSTADEAPLDEDCCVQAAETVQCWEVLKPPEREWDFVALVFKGLGGDAIPHGDWKPFALLPPEQQKMQNLRTTRSGVPR